MLFWLPLRPRHRWGVVLLCVATTWVRGDSSCVVATYNVENYHLRDWGNRHEKPAPAREAVAGVLERIHPDILALQEIGEPAALDELQRTLATRGLNLPHREHLGGWDTNLFVALLSRFPIVRHAPHTNDSFLLDGRRFHVSRPVLEVDLALSPNFRLTVISAHLKSRRPVGAADESALRLAEAQQLRRHIDTALLNPATQALLVCGDFNDSPDSRTLKTILGHGRLRLLDTRPAERPLDDDQGAAAPARSITWTHFFAREDGYSRIDYLLLSPALEALKLRRGTYVWSGPEWGRASDHRPVVFAFRIPDR